MDSRVISGIIGGLLTAAVITYWTTRVRSSATDGTLRYGWGLAVLGACCLAFVAAAAGAFAYDVSIWTDRGEFLAVIFIIVFFGIGSIYSFGEFFFVRGSYDDDGIEFYTPWTGNKQEKWRDLQSIKFNATLSWYVLYFRTDNTIRLSTFLSGHQGALSVVAALGYTIESPQ